LVAIDTPYIIIKNYLSLNRKKGRVITPAPDNS